MIRRLFYLASVAVIAWAAALVPLPLVEVAPGTVTPIAPLITIEDLETSPLDGEFSLTTIRLSQPSSIDALRATLSETRTLDLRQSVIPAGIERSEYFRLQRAQFQRSFELAAAVGLEEAGFEVTVRSSVMIVNVLPDGPAGDALQAGDRILTLEGEPIEDTDELISLLGDHDFGDEVSLRVRREDQELDVTVELGQVPGLEQAGLGIVPETVGDVELPFQVTLDEATRIGGPSAGLMIALTVFDLVSGQDVAQGRRIAGTGTLDADGNVGTIGGIEEKVTAAADAGVTLFLAPAGQIAEAAAAAPAHLPVFGVATFEDALRVLEREA